MFENLQQVEADDYSASRYGNYGIIQSETKPDREIVHVKEVQSSLAEKKLWIRGRLHTSRGKGKIIYVLLYMQNVYKKSLKRF